MNDGVVFSGGPVGLAFVDRRWLFAFAMLMANVSMLTSAGYLQVMLFQV